jgi:hypothetical protein
MYDERVQPKLAAHEADFIKHEIFKHIFMKCECSFLFDNEVIE